MQTILLDMEARKLDHTSIILSVSRREAITRSKLRDAPPNDIYDGLAEKVCFDLRVPVGLISLVDIKYQFFKGQNGLPPELDIIRKTSLSQSLCQEVVCQGGMLAVSDLRDHGIYFNHPIHTELGVIAYLGEPLYFDHEIIGAVCAVDMRSHLWSERDKSILKEITREVQAEVYYRYLAMKNT